MPGAKSSGLFLRNVLLLALYSSTRISIKGTSVRTPTTVARAASEANLCPSATARPPVAIPGESTFSGKRETRLPG